MLYQKFLIKNILGRLQKKKKKKLKNKKLFI